MKACGCGRVVAKIGSARAQGRPCAFPKCDKVSFALWRGIFDWASRQGPIGRHVPDQSASFPALNEVDLVNLVENGLLSTMPPAGGDWPVLSRN
jgi:hypothetical protein